MGNKHKSFAKKHNKKIVAIFLVIVLFIAVFIVPSMASENLDTNLGFSGIGVDTSRTSIMPTATGDIKITEVGSVATGDLKLVLSELPDAVLKATMTRPDGVTETKDTIPTDGTKKPLPLGASGKAINETEAVAEKATSVGIMVPTEVALQQLIDNDGEQQALLAKPEGEVNDMAKADKATLGTSGSAETGKINLFSSGAGFTAPTYGIYVFELYGNDGTNDVLIDRVSYMVKLVMSDEALTVSITGSGPEFYLQDKQNVYVRYVPQLIGNKEILTIVVPPMYTIARPPDSAPGYVVSQVSTMPLPEDIYDDAASDILKTFPAITNVQYFTITFDGSIDQGMSFSFDTQYSGTAVNNGNLGKIMLAYGTDAEKVPMRIGGFGKSEDGTILVDKEAINGRALIKDAKKIVLPHHNQNAGLYPSYPGDAITEGLSREPIRIVSWHYPMTDIRVYYSYDPAIITPKAAFPGHQETIDGQVYWVVTWTEAQMLGAAHNIGSDQRYFFNYGTNFDFPPNTSLREDDIISFGPTMVDYTYLGVEYKHQNAGNTIPFVMTKYENMNSFSFYFKGTPGIWGGGPLDRELEQGTTGEKFRFGFRNSSGYNNSPTYVYEDAKVIFDLPEGVYPTSINMPNLRKAVIQSIEYYLADSPGVPVYEHPTANFGVHTFGISGDDRITKLIINYDAIHNASAGEYWLSAKIGTTKPDGTPMDTVENVSMSVTIKTKNDMKTMGSTSAAPVYKPFTYTTNQAFKLVRYEQEDTLRFGSVQENSNTINLYDGVESRSQSRLGAGFKKFSLLMKDYENVVIEVMPYQGDAKLMSFIKGYYFSNLTPGIHVEKNDVYYKTNLKPWTRSEFVSGHIHHFDLDQAAGEYVTGVKAELGTLYGDALVANVGTSSSVVDADGYSHIRDAQQHMFSPIIFESKRAFFENTPEKEDLPLTNVTSRLEYKVSTTSEAQHINKIGTPHPTLNSDKTKVSANLVSYITQGFGHGGARVQITQTSQFQGSIFEADLYLNGSHIYRAPVGGLDYYAKIYIEVHKDFSIVEIPGCTLVEVKTASDTGNKVYIFETFIGNNTNQFNRKVKLFVHPDAAAPVSGVKPFVRGGVSEDAFVASYMTNDDYYKVAPYTIYKPTGHVLYPEWNIQSNLFWRMTFDYKQTVNTQVNSLTSVQLFPLVDGKVQADQGLFRDHEKATLALRGSMGNNSGGEIPHYEAKFAIPKKDRNTRTPDKDNPGIPINMTNEFNMYVTGPVEINQALLNLDVKYLRKDGSVVDITAPTPDWENIYDVVVKFDKLADRHNEMIVIPLGTSASKYGNDFTIYKAYLGAEARYASTPGVWGQYALSHALEYDFDHYRTGVRVGQDIQEIGRYQAALTDPSLVKIQSYYDDNGVEKELEVLNVGGELQFNRDATRMTATVLKPDAFYITPANYIPDDNNDSDFIVTSPANAPKIKAEINITWDDLEKRTANKYDIALYAIPYVTVPDSLKVHAHTMVNITPVIKRVWDNANIPNPPVNSYLREVSSNTVPTIAKIVANASTRQINISALKPGETTYLFTVENRFGEKFTVAQPIRVTVVPNYVPSSRVYKEFDAVSESKNLGSPAKDTFSFEAWAGDDVDDQTDKYTVVGVNESTFKAITKLERGETNYIREIAQEGYVSMGFRVIDRGNPVTVTHVKDGIYAFDLPTVASNVYITAINKNDALDMTVKKLLKAGSHMENPSDTFNITVTDKGSSAVVVNENFAPDDIVTAADLQYGRTYVVKENLPAGSNYEIDSAKIKLSGAPTGTDIAGANNTYEITIAKGQKNAEITITNKYAEGAGMALSKYMPDLTNANLPKERFEFTLASNNNFKAFGLVDSTAPAYPATVKWYKTGAYNPADLYPNLNTLPIGNYTLTEIGTNTNFVFEKYIANGTTVTNKVHTFTVTKTSPIQNIGAYNKIKTIGSVTLNKSLVSADFLNETLEFSLTHRATGQVYSGKTTITGDNIVFNNWKISPANTNHQGGLPLGEYHIIEEDNQYFDFGAFTADPRITTINGGKTAVFTLTGDSTNNAITIAASNTLKQGKLTLNKRVTTSLGSHTNRDFHFELYKYDKTTGTGTVIDLNGAASGNATSITVTQADLISGKALVLPGTFDYGSYYVVEKDDTDFALQVGTSSVLAETAANVSAKVFNIVHPTNTEVTAVNRLKSAPQALEVYKVAKDADQVGANTFAFELYSKDYANVETLIYSGQVLSTASGIGSTTGANVVWTPAGGGAQVIGIAGLPYGNYVVKETATGDDFLPLDVSASGFGSKVSATVYEFPVGSTTGSLADFFVKFENKLRNDGTILVNKTFENNFNPFPTTSFVFKLKNTLSGKIYTGETTGATPVSNWKDANGVLIPTSEIPYGRYELTENADANYDLVEFKTISGLVTIPPAKTSASVTINATNKKAEVAVENKVKQDGAIDLYKLFENGYNHDATSAFTVEIQGPFDGSSIGTAPKQRVTLQSSSQWKSVISNLKYGYYRVTEILDPTSDYYLVSINSTSSPTGTPVAVDVEIGAKAGQSKTQKIDITNKVASDGKITITKAMDGINTLPDQMFDFTVTDGLGKSQTVQIKAGESKTFGDLLLGEYSIKESLVPDFDHIDFTLNGGSKVTAPEVSIVLSGGTRDHKLISTSKVKADGTFTIRADFADVDEKPDLAEEFTFQILQSINGGAWEAPKQRSSEYVTLKIGESHTITDLLRGAEYKAVSVQLPTSPFEVSKIVINSGEKHTVIEEKEAIFVPVEGELLSDITFMLDIKRTELIIDKFIYYRYSANGTGFYLPDGSIVYGEAWPDMKVSGAEFTLYRYDSKGELHTTANWKKLTDDYGAIVYGGLSVGKYQIKETKSPKGYGILHHSFDFEVHNDPLTGKLFLTTDELPEGVTMSKDNVLGIPNLFLHQTSRDNTNGKLDGDSPLGEKPEEPVGDYLQSIESFGLLPAAGGFPVAIVALVGILAVAIGIFVKKKDKKDKQ